MEIKDLTWNEISSRRFNNLLFPKSIRSILVGKSALWEDDFAIELSIETWMVRL